MVLLCLLLAEGYADVIVSDIENEKVVDIEVLLERSGCDGQEEKNARSVRWIRVA